MKVLSKLKCLECGTITKIEDMPSHKTYQEIDGEIWKDAEWYCPSPGCINVGDTRFEEIYEESQNEQE